MQVPVYEDFVEASKALFLRRPEQCRFVCHAKKGAVELVVTDDKVTYSFIPSDKNRAKLADKFAQLWATWCCEEFLPSNADELPNFPAA